MQPVSHAPLGFGAFGGFTFGGSDGPPVPSAFGAFGAPPGSICLSSNAPFVSGYYGCEDLSDCSVETEDGEVLPCHKVILSAASPVFKAMFGRDSSMLEAVSSAVKLREVAPEVVKQLLQHIYGRHANVPLQHLVSFYKLADQYQVKSAKNSVKAAVQNMGFTLKDLEALMPAAAALGDAAAPLRKLLAVKAAAHIQEMISQKLQLTHSWGALEVSTIVSQPNVPAHQAILLAASWAEAQPSRAQEEWPAIQQQLNLQPLSYDQLKGFQDNPQLLKLPGFAVALFAECIARMELGKMRCGRSHSGMYDHTSMGALGPRR